MADVSTIAGIPSYWAPEQQGLISGTPGTRSDIYALGVTIGVMLTGRRPQEVLDILRGTSNMLPPEVKQALRRATDDNPENCYATLKGLIRALSGAGEAFYKGKSTL
jgi:serine/threonine protein kinase